MLVPRWIWSLCAQQLIYFKILISAYEFLILKIRHLRNMIIKSTLLINSFFFFWLSLWLDDSQLVCLNGLDQGSNLATFKHSFYAFDLISEILNLKD